MDINAIVNDMVRSEVAKALRAAASAIEGRPIAIGPTVTVRSSDHFPVPPTAIPVKQKRQRKPKATRHAMRDASGKTWAGVGRKPAGFDDSTAAPINGAA